MLISGTLLAADSSLGRISHFKVRLHRRWTGLEHSASLGAEATRRLVSSSTFVAHGGHLLVVLCGDFYASLWALGLLGLMRTSSTSEVLWNRLLLQRQLSSRCYTIMCFVNNNFASNIVFQVGQTPVLASSFTVCIM
jgi:hypothetical protein